MLFMHLRGVGQSFVLMNMALVLGIHLLDLGGQLLMTRAMEVVFDFAIVAMLLQKVQGNLHRHENMFRLLQSAEANRSNIRSALINGCLYEFILCGHSRKDTPLSRAWIQSKIKRCSV